MHRIYLLIALFFIVSICFADGKPADYPGKYEKGQIVPLFGDNVNIRENPSLKGKIADRLSIASVVTIEEKTEEILVIKNYKEFWYRIEYKDGKGAKKSGYVWGGLLAKGYLHEDLDGDGEKEWALFGIVGRAKCRSEFEARYVKAGRILSQLKFEAIETNISEGPGSFYYFVYTGILDKDGFTPPLKLIRVNFEYGACDYANGDILFYLDGNKLRYGFSAVWVSGEAGSIDVKYIFPGDKGGKQNYIIIKYTAEELDMDTGKTVSSNTRYEKYFWNGSTLAKKE
jgi:hypothetical protein